MPRNVICYETGRRYDSCKAAGEWAGCSAASVYDACRFGTAGAHYHFYFADEPEPDASFFRNKVKSAVRCVETGKEFGSMVAAGAWAGCPPQHISVAAGRGTRAKGYHWERVGEQAAVVCIRDGKVCSVTLFRDYDAARAFIRRKEESGGGEEWQIAPVTER